MSHGDGERSATGGHQRCRLHTTDVRADARRSHGLCSSRLRSGSRPSDAPGRWPYRSLSRSCSPSACWKN